MGKKFLWLAFMALSVHAGNGIEAKIASGANRAHYGSRRMEVNPASLLLDHSLESTMGILRSNEHEHSQVSFSFLDSKSGTWGMGMAYQMGLSAKEGVPTDHNFLLGIAMPLVTDAVIVGSGLSYAFDRTVSLDAHHFFNMDIGLLLKAPFGVNVAVVVDRILTPKAGEDPMALSFGLGYDAAADINMAFDWTMADVKNDLDQDHIIGAGLGFLVADLVPIRLGFNHRFARHKSRIHVVSGLEGQAYAIHVFYQQDLKVGRFRDLGINFTVKM